MTYEEFIADSKTIDAVVRNFEVIGEAANRLPESLKDAATNVDWHKMRGLRNRIAHHYFGLNFEIIWTAIEEDIDDLIKKMQTLLH
jgi:uncharacterized protein with HEPN domain